MAELYLDGRISCDPGKPSPCLSSSIQHIALRKVLGFEHGSGQALGLMQTYRPDTNDNEPLYLLDDAIAGCVDHQQPMFEP